MLLFDITGAIESFVTFIVFELAEVFQASSVNFAVIELDHSVRVIAHIEITQDQSTAQFHKATAHLYIVKLAFASHVPVISIVHDDVRFAETEITGASGIIVSTVTVTVCDELFHTFQISSIRRACMLFVQAKTGTQGTAKLHAQSTFQLAITIQDQFNISTLALASHVHVIVTVAHEVVISVDVIVGETGAVVSRFIDQVTELVFQAASVNSAITAFCQSHIENVTSIQVDVSIAQLNVHTIQAQLKSKVQTSLIVRLMVQVEILVTDQAGNVRVQTGSVESRVIVKSTDQTEIFQAASLDTANNVFNHSTRGTEFTAKTHNQSETQVAITQVHLRILTFEFASAVPFIVIEGVLTKVQVASVITGASGATVSTITVNGGVESVETFPAQSVSLATKSFDPSKTGIHEIVKLHATLLHVAITVAQLRISTSVFDSHVQESSRSEPDVEKFWVVIVGATGGVVSSVKLGNCTILLPFHSAFVTRKLQEEYVQS